MVYIHPNRLLVFCLSLLIGIIGTQCHCGNPSKPSSRSGQPNAPDTEPESKNGLKPTDFMVKTARDAGYTDLADKLDEITKGNLQNINKPLDEVANPGITALHNAVELGNPSIIQFLLDHGANINAQDDNGNTPLQKAINTHHVGEMTNNAFGGENMQAIKLLLNKGAKIDTTNKKEDSPLSLAIRSGLTEIVKLLLDKDPTLLQSTTYPGTTALHDAVTSGYPAIIQCLLDHGVDINAQTDNGLTPLYSAIIANIIGDRTKNKLEGASMETFNLLLNKGANIRTPNERGMTPLYTAIHYGLTEIVKLLVDKDPTLLQSTHQGFCRYETYLHTAARDNREVEIVKLLLDKDPTLLNAIDQSGQTPLQVALWYKNPDVAKFLINQGANISSNLKDSTTALIVAIIKGQTDIVQLLLQKDPNLIRKKDTLGNYPIHKAAKEGHVDIFQLLLDYGADSNAKSSLYETPLHVAVKNKKDNIDVVRKLLSYPTTDIHALDNKGHSPLYWAIEAENNLDIIQLLLENGAKVDKKDLGVLNAVIEKGKPDILKLLLDHGFPLDIKAPEAHQLWDLALEKGNKEIIQLLRPVDPTFTDLHFAARQGDIEAAKQLLQTNPGLKNTQDEHGNTPLHIAARNGQKEFVKLLLENRVDAHIVNSDGYDTAYLLAGRYNHPEIQKLLEAQDTSDKSLYNAVKEKNKEQVKALIEKEPGLMYVKDLEGWTPFDQAISVGDISIIELFLNKDPNLVHIKSLVPFPPLHAVVMEDHPNVVNYLLTKGADINAKDQYGNTPLVLAIKDRNKNIVELLVNNNADVNAQNDEHQTPLSMAIEKELPDIVDLLLKKGADVNFQAHALIGSDFSVKPPLSLAIRKGNMPIIQSLLAKHPDINAKDAAGRTPLCEAVNNKQVVKMLFQQPIKPDVNILFKDQFKTTKHLITPLYVVARAGHKEVVELLIDKGADVNQGGAGHEALPLHTAIKYQHSIWSNSGQHRDTITLLVQREANVSLQDDLGNTSLHIAASMGDIQTAELLFSKDPATINIQNNRGNTPLHEAVINEQIEIIKWLLNKGADKNIRNLKGQLPADLATRNKVVDLLK